MTKKTTAKKTSKKTVAKTSAKLTKVEYGIKEEYVPKPAPEKIPGPPPKKIRMLMSVANEKIAYTVGHVYKTGKDISPNTAKSYVRTGVAEEDHSDEPPETK